jgi:cell wall-associated NlpC family hydrolase
MMDLFDAALIQDMKKASQAKSRQVVVDIAHTWIGTPYHHAARLKGIGVDCAMLPAAVYEEAGLIDHIQMEHYPQDWHVHTDTTKFTDVVAVRAFEVPEPTGPGDFVLFKFGRAFAHGGIITSWPYIIHSMLYIGVLVEDTSTGRLQRRDRRFYTLWK